MISNVYSKSYLQTSASLTAITQRLVYGRLLPKLRELANPREGTREKYLFSCMQTSADALKSKNQGGLVDAHALSSGITMDFVTAYLFGLSRSSNFIENEKECNWWIRQFLDRRPYTFWAAELPALVQFLQKWFRINIVPIWVDQANENLDAWALKMCDAVSKDAKYDTAGKNEDSPETEATVMHQLHNAMVDARSSSSAKKSNSRSKSELPSFRTQNLRLSIASDMHDHLAAGQETSNITLSYIFYELARYQDIQALLRQEIATLSPPIRLPKSNAEQDGQLPSLPTAKALDNLPVLNSIILETLRLHAPIPAPQPRVTPDGGVVTNIPNTTITTSHASISTNASPTTSKDKNVTDSKSSHKTEYTEYFLPSNIRISANAHSLHRIPAVFPSPEEWRPQRWLPFGRIPSDASDAGTESDTDPETDRLRLLEMHRHFWAFSSGGHMCLGNNFALQTLKVVVAAVVSGFEILPPPFGDDDAAGEADGNSSLGSREEWEKFGRQVDAYTAQPVRESLLVLLREIN